MEKKTIYLAYGSNLNLAQMAQRCPTARVLGTTVLHDHRLLFKGHRGGAVATVEPCEGHSVPVLLWEITPADEIALDRYEGYPYLYRKETVKVKLGKKTVTAMVYIMNVDYAINTPSSYYYRTILRGCEDNRIGTDELLNALRYSIAGGIEYDG